MLRQVLASSAFTAALLLGSAGVQAGGCYGSSCRPAPCQGSSCYNLVQTPPVYDTVAETYLAQPSQTQSRVVPAQYEYTTEQVMIHPPRQIPRYTQAHYETVTEKVLISAATKRWEVSRDHNGNLTGCWVHVPAQYGHHQRRVQVSPASVAYETIPAVYGERQRKVMVSPTYVAHDTIPAVYETRHRRVQTSPGSQYWARTEANRY